MNVHVNSEHGRDERERDDDRDGSAMMKFNDDESSMITCRTKQDLAHYFKAWKSAARCRKKKTL